jgi:hypothetical protein
LLPAVAWGLTNKKNSVGAEQLLSANFSSITYISLFVEHTPSFSCSMVKAYDNGGVVAQPV